MTAPVYASPRQSHQRAERQAPPAGHQAAGGHHLTLRPWGVVAIWAALLGLLAATNAGFGNNALVLEVSGSAAGFILLLAGAVWLDRRLRPARGYLRQPTRVGGVIMFAVAIALALLGTAFGAWLMMLASVPFLAALGLEVSARRQTRALAAAAFTGQQPAPHTPGNDPAAPGPRSPAPQQAPPSGRDRVPVLTGMAR